MTYAKLLLLSMVVVLSACGVNRLGEPLKGPGWYRVKPTDTLYSVAWRYGLDYQELARWNGLSDPYRIYPGQQLVLIQPKVMPAPVAKAPPKPAGGRQPPPKPVRSTTAKAPAKLPANNLKIDWRWPTQGTVLNRFSFKDLDKRGIDIAGQIGQPVHAVADGKVVYSGDGLAGYGNLIIVKHNESFLSAYAFNRVRLAQEGAQVRRGDKISEMGQNKDKKALLHFQIRKNGKPVDPLRYLPSRK